MNSKYWHISKDDTYENTGAHKCRNLRNGEWLRCQRQGGGAERVRLPAPIPAPC